VHAPRELIERLRIALAGGQLELVETSTGAILPRARDAHAGEPVVPVRDGDETLLDNGLLRARTGDRGVLLDLASPRTRVPVSQANLVAGLGRSSSEMSIELRGGEPFLRIALSIHRRRLWGRLRLENWFAFADARVRYGSDGRFAALEDDRAGCAIFAAPGTTWKLRTLSRGGVHLRCEPFRERDEAQLAWAFAPFEPGISTGVLEAAWDAFARGRRVRLFRSDDPAIVVDACRPAPEGSDVLVHVREVDGAARPLHLQCGARMREVDGDARIEGEAIVSDIDAFGEREFRVRF